MRNTIDFLIGDEPRSLRDVDPTMTVLNCLRLQEHLRGTKEGCAEGNRGACTVILADRNDGRLR